MKVPKKCKVETLTNSIMNTIDFINICFRAITDNDPVALESVVCDFAEFCYKETTDIVMDEFVVEFLIDEMLSNKFQVMDEGYKLLMILEYNWSAFEKTAKAAILDAINMSYNSYTDPMAWFVLSEVLGKYYCSRESFNVLKNLINHSGDGPRSQVAYALEQIIKHSNDLTLRSESTLQLLNLRSDRSIVVRDEVETSLQRLGIELGS